MKGSFSPISSLGEFGLIDKFKTISSRYSNPGVLNGIGDDAAVVKPSAGKLSVFTTDIMVQGVHFDLSYTSMRHLGSKAAVSNLSDIAAMSAVPIAAFVSLGLHPGLSVEMVEEFYSALAEELGKNGCVIAGGDISASPIGLVINIGLLGEVEPERRVLRSGARMGDVVCVTGDLGRSHAGLKILRRERDRYIESGQPEDFTPNFEGYDDALHKHLLPESRVALSRTVTEKIRVHSMIDISDGLSSDVLHLCRASGVTAELDEEFIPIDPITRKVAQSFDEDALVYALNGGEDYELVFTIAESDFTKLYSLEGNIRAIGRITEGDPKVVIKRIDGSTETLADFASYQHFSRSK